MEDGERFVFLFFPYRLVKIQATSEIPIIYNAGVLVYQDHKNNLLIS